MPWVPWFTGLGTDNVPGQAVPTVSLAEAGCSPSSVAVGFLRMRTEEVPSEARAVLKVGRDPKWSLCLRIM